MHNFFDLMDMRLEQQNGLFDVRSDLYTYKLFTPFTKIDDIDTTI